MRAIDYKFVTVRDSAELSNQVAQLLQKGWQPLGGACAGGHGVYGQALVLAGESEVPVRRLAYVEGKNIGDLTLKVEERLTEGWVPYNSLTVAQIGSETRFYQTMVAGKKLKADADENE